MTLIVTAGWSVGGLQRTISIQRSEQMTKCMCERMPKCPQYLPVPPVSQWKCKMASAQQYWEYNIAMRVKHMLLHLEEVLLFQPSCILLSMGCQATVLGVDALC